MTNVVHKILRMNPKAIRADEMFGYVKNSIICEVFVIHVGGTRGVPWSIDRSIQRHACITWGVEFIRAIFFIIFLYG